MSLTPTISVADQAFPAVTSPQSSEAFVTPSRIFVEDQPLAHPSDVGFSPLPSLPEINISLQPPPMNIAEYLVLPNRKQNLPTSDPVSPIVFEIIGWPAADRIQVKQAIKGIIIPPLSPNQLPQGNSAVAQTVDLLSLGFSILGRQILMVDKPTYLEPLPFKDLSGGGTIDPVTTTFASQFDEVDGAFIIGIQGTDTLILSLPFNNNPATSGAWLILDQRLGSEVESNDYAFAGTFEPAPNFPIFEVVNAPLNIDGGTVRPQFSPPPAFSPDAPQALPANSGTFGPASVAQPFIPNAPQALPPILQNVNAADEAFDGLPTSYFP